MSAYPQKVFAIAGKNNISPKKAILMYQQICTGKHVDHSTNKIVDRMLNQYKETTEQRVYRKLAWVFINSKKAKYRDSGKYHNNILKTYNRQVNNYQKNHTPYKDRKYEHDFSNED